MRCNWLHNRSKSWWCSSSNWCRVWRNRLVHKHGWLDTNSGNEKRSHRLFIMRLMHYFHNLYPVIHVCVLADFVIPCINWTKSTIKIYIGYAINYISDLNIDGALCPIDAGYDEIGLYTNMDDWIQTLEMKNKNHRLFNMRLMHWKKKYLLKNKFWKSASAQTWMTGYNFFWKWTIAKLL